MKKDVNLSLVQGGKLTKSGWLSIVAFLLVAVLALSVALGLVVKSGKEKKGTEELSVGGGMVLPEETEENGISLTSTVIPKEQYEEYGIMPIAETSYSVTATAKAEGGVELSEAQQKFNWSLAWASSNSSDVNTYVSLSASEGARSATVSLLQPFSTQILLKCTWAYNDTQSGSVTLDYAKRFKGFNIQYASSVAKSASDESHLTTVLVEPNVGSSKSVELDMYLASPFVDGSWQNSAWNATVFRIVEPVFDSVGTIENSVVSVKGDYGADVFPVDSSSFNEISDQLYFFFVYFLKSSSLIDYACFDDEGRASDQVIPRKTNSFTQTQFLKCFFRENDYLTDVFGDASRSPTDLVSCSKILSNANGPHTSVNDITDPTCALPNQIVLQYGDVVVVRDLNIVFKFHTDLSSASSIDFTQSNFIF